MRADHKREELDVHLIALLKVDLDLLILDPLDLTRSMGLETRHRDVDCDVLAPCDPAPNKTTSTRFPLPNWQTPATVFVPALFIARS